MTPTTPETKGKILLVDDDPGLLRLLSIRLRAEQYEVEAVESAEKALSVLSRFRPDLVISDLRMDKMDGIGLLKELQTRSPGLRVLIMTAHGTIPDAVVATQSGAFGFLTKPIDKDELMSTVDKALRVSGSAEVTAQRTLPSFSIKPMMCFNRSTTDYSFDKNGFIRISTILAANRQYARAVKQKMIQEPQDPDEIKPQP